MYVRILSGPRPSDSYWKAIISSLMAASVLLCRRVIRCLHLRIVLWGAATTKAGAAPHLLTHRGDAVTGPIRWPPQRVLIPRRPQRYSPGGADRSTPPDPIPAWPKTEPLGLECPLSFAPTRLAVGFGPKELSPTLLLRAIHPGTFCKGPGGSPASRRHPGARRYGYAVVNLMYTPVTSCCQYFFCQQIQSPLLSRVPFAKFEKSSEEACTFRTLGPLQRSTKTDHLVQDSAYSCRVWITLIKLLYAPLHHPKITPDIHPSE